MSDLMEAATKAQQGAEWRGEVAVEIAGDVHDLTIRPLFDPEMRKVKSLIDISTLREIRESIPDDVRDEYQELQDKEDRTEEEEERLVELAEEMEEAKGDVETPDGFYEAMRLAARKGIVPDQSDVQQAMADPDFVQQVEQDYDIGRVNEPEDLYDPDKEGPVAGHPGPLKDHIQKTLVDRATDGASYVIGMAVLEKQLEDEGN